MRKNNGTCKKGLYERCVKRILDIVCSCFALIVLSPLLLVLSLFVRVKLGSPIIFKQLRPGLNEKNFYLYKFRTMTDAKDENGNLLPDEIRLTSFGRKLRSTSLDELPELWNIFKGDMSIVGPRPLIPEYLPYYTEEERRRHEVRPGLSGLAQVNGRSFISWEEIFAYDMEYVNKITFLVDAQIMLNTVKKVFTRENIADLSEAWKDEDGKFHYSLNGEDCILHQPMNIERRERNAQRNWK